MPGREQQEEVIALCQALIRRPGVSGREDGVVAELSRFFREKGFDDIFVDAYGSVTGIINGKRPGPTIVFDGHIDTVPVPDPSAWQHEPYGAERVDGRIYGRGASDMKGAVAAMACAAAGFAGATKRDFGGRLCVAGVVHEECFEGVAASLISERLKPDYVIIGEASECNLKIGQRGRAEITVETFGVPAHSANPEKGVNAVLLMMEAARSVRRTGVSGRVSFAPTEATTMQGKVMFMTSRVRAVFIFWSRNPARAATMPPTMGMHKVSICKKMVMKVMG